MPSFGGLRHLAPLIVRSRQPEMVAQGAPLVLLAEQAASAQLGDDHIDEIVQRSGEPRGHDIEPVGRFVAEPVLHHVGHLRRGADNERVPPWPSVQQAEFPQCQIVAACGFQQQALPRQRAVRIAHHRDGPVQRVPIQTADAELQLDLLEETLTLCPTLYWEERGAHFILAKCGDQRYRCQFFYGDVEQFGDSLGDCIVTLLRVQADHEKDRQGVHSGMNAIDFGKLDDGEEYHPPLIV